MEKSYYDIRVRSKDNTKNFLIMMNVHEDLADLHISREAMNSLYKGMIVYKEKSMLN